MGNESEVQQHRAASAEAQARGDTRAANAAYAAELQALSGVQPDTSAESLDDTDTDAGETLGGEEKTEEPGEDTQFPQHVPIPVEITDRVYRAFLDDFGEDEAANLQRAWGNNAFQNEQIVRAVIRDHPRLDQVYVHHQTENGLSYEGVVRVLRYVLDHSDESGASGESFLKNHPELVNIFDDHADEQGNISITGAYRLLHYIGKQSGYRHTYRGKQR